jgi:hypothetical protein
MNTSLKQRMVSNVVSYNIHLKETAPKMPINILYANCHPSDRPDFLREMSEDDRKSCKISTHTNLN